MKINVKAVVAAVSLFAIISCKSKSAFNYSQAIVKIEKSMESDVISAETRITDYLTREIYDSALVATERMESIADSKLKEVEALETPKVEEADNFRHAAIRYFSYIRSVYTAYKDYILQASVEDREAARLRMMKVLDEKNNTLKNMQDAQRKFAKANGFKLDNNYHSTR